MRVQPEASTRKLPPVLPEKPDINHRLARWARHEEIQQPAQLTQPAHRRGGAAVDPQPGSRGAPVSGLELVARRRPRAAAAAADGLSRAAAGDEPVARITTESRPFADPGRPVLRRALSRRVL